MTISRREFAATLGAVGFSGQGELPSADSVRALLDARGGRAIFDDPQWLDLLRQALELNSELRGILTSYVLSADAEPTITFTRY